MTDFIMKAKTLQKHWTTYMTKVAVQAHPILNQGDFALLFGHDELKFNTKKKEVRLPSGHWLAIEGLTSLDNVDWLALYNNQGAWIGITGRGNPYSDEFLEILPHTQGIIRAVPHSLADFFA